MKKYRFNDGIVVHANTPSEAIFTYETISGNQNPGFIVENGNDKELLPFTDGVDYGHVKF